MPSARCARCFADALRPDGGSVRTIARLEEWTNDGSDFGHALRSELLASLKERETFHVLRNCELVPLYPRKAGRAGQEDGGA